MRIFGLICIFLGSLLYLDIVPWSKTRKVATMTRFQKVVLMLEKLEQASLEIGLGVETLHPTELKLARRLMFQSILRMQSAATEHMSMNDMLNAQLEYEKEIILNEVMQ